MKLLLSVLLLVSASRSFARAWTCDDISQAIKEKDVHHRSLKVTEDNITGIQKNILRQAYVEYGAFSKKEAAAKSAKELFDSDPQFTTYYIADSQLTSVNLDFGDNSFIFLFDGLEYTGIRQDDGSVSVNGQNCDVKLDLFQ